MIHSTKDEYEINMNNNNKLFEAELLRTLKMINGNLTEMNNYLARIADHIEFINEKMDK